MDRASIEEAVQAAMKQGYEVQVTSPRGHEYHRYPRVPVADDVIQLDDRLQRVLAVTQFPYDGVFDSPTVVRVNAVAEAKSKTPYIVGGVLAALALVGAGAWYYSSSSAAPPAPALGKTPPHPVVRPPSPAPAKPPPPAAPPMPSVPTPAQAIQTGQSLLGALQSGNASSALASGLGGLGGGIGNAIGSIGKLFPGNPLSGAMGSLTGDANNALGGLGGALGGNDTSADTGSLADATQGLDFGNMADS